MAVRRLNNTRQTYRNTTSAEDRAFQRSFGASVLNSVRGTDRGVATTSTNPNLRYNRAATRRAGRWNDADIAGYNRERGLFQFGRDNSASSSPTAHK